MKSKPSHYLTLFCTFTIWVSTGYSRNVDAYPVSVSDIPLVFNEVSEQKIERSFATFIHEVNGSQVNVQFSYENGKAGLDWVMRTPRNKKDKKQFLKLAESMNYTVSEKEMNGVEYLRIENDDKLPKLVFPDGNGGYNELPREKAIPFLCTRVFRVMYGLSDDDEVYMYFEGVKFEKE